MRITLSNTGDDIRKISRYEELKRLIKDLQGGGDPTEAGAIAGAKSIAYIGANGETSEATPATVGATQPTGFPGGIGYTTATGLQLGAVSAGNSVIATSGDSAGLAADRPVNNDRDGFYDAKSLLDGAKDAFGKAAPPISTGGPLEGNAIVASITGLKDASGRSIVLHTVDAARQFLAPDDRESSFAASSNLDPSYTPGRVWSLIWGGNRYFSNSFGGLVAIREGLDLSTCYGYVGLYISTLTPSVGDNLQFSFNPNMHVGDFAGSGGGMQYGFQAYSAGVQMPPGAYGQQDCGLTILDGVACSADPPYATTWADLGYTQLGLLTPLSGGISPYSYALMGRWVAHVYEKDVPQEYKDGLSTLNLFLSDGTTPVTVAPLQNGGLAMFYGTNTPDGSATANSVYTLDNKRIPSGYITPNQYTSMIPY